MRCSCAQRESRITTTCKMEKKERMINSVALEKKKRKEESLFDEKARFLEERAWRLTKAASQKRRRNERETVSIAENGRGGGATKDNVLARGIPTLLGDGVCCVL